MKDKFGYGTEKTEKWNYDMNINYNAKDIGEEARNYVAKNIPYILWFYLIVSSTINGLLYLI